jgi:hypothetical protein
LLIDFVLRKISFAKLAVTGLFRGSNWSSYDEIDQVGGEESECSSSGPAVAMHDGLMY